MLFAGIFALKVAKLNSFFSSFYFERGDNRGKFPRRGEWRWLLCQAGTFWHCWDSFAWLGLLSFLKLLGLAETSWPDWNFLAWLGLLGLARTSWPGWDFLAWLELLGLDGTSWPAWDFLAWMGLLGLDGTSLLGWDFLAWLGLLGLAGTSWQLMKQT